MKRSRTFGLLVTCVAVAGFVAPATHAKIPDPPKGGEAAQVHGTAPVAAPSMPRLAERFPEGRPSHDRHDRWADDLPAAAAEPEGIGTRSTGSEGVSQVYADRLQDTAVGGPDASFDWAEVGVGAGIAFGALLLVGSLMLVMGRRVRVVRHSP